MTTQDTTDELMYWMAVNQCGGFSQSSWQKHFGDLTAKQVLTDKARIEHSTLSANLKNFLRQPDWQQIDNELKWAESHNNHIITYFDDKYPHLLRQIVSAPLTLYVQGEPKHLANPQIAMVGSRNASINAIQTAKRFAYALAKAGLTITSGMALGIDGASHEGCLAANGKTIAVLGTGLNVIYPRQNQKLASKIIENGAIVSEYPLNMPIKRQNFPKRNRLISGLSFATLVVEASLRSGSLITAKMALEQNREVLAIPGSIHNPGSKGCHQLLKQGAVLIESIEDILQTVVHFAEFIARDNLQVAENPENTQILEVGCSNMLQYVGYEVTPVDDMIYSSGLSISQINIQLNQLELDGFIQKVPGGYIKKVRNTV